MTDLRERVARAICGGTDDIGDGWKRFLPDADAAIAALEADRDALREAVREWREARAEATEHVSPETWARLADAESRLAKHGGTK